MNNFYEALMLLGQALGIEPSYKDNWGKLHATLPATAARILETKGIRLRADLMNLNPQVLVVSSNDLPDKVKVFFEASPSEDRLGVAARVSLIEQQSKFPPIDFSFPAADAPFAIDESTGLPALSLPFPPDLDAGWYHVHVSWLSDATERVADCLWIVCPSKAYVPAQLESGRKIAGVALALYGVRSETNWGVGDFHDLHSIIDWAVDALGVDFVGLNPLHALFNRQPVNHSPYLPSSRLFHNFIYLYVPGVAGFQESSRANALVQSAEIQARLRRLRLEPHVNYEDVAELKGKVLKEAFASFLTIHGPTGRMSDRWREFQAFRDAEGSYLELFATFCALHEHFASVLPDAPTWRDWPAPYQDPASDAVRQFREERETEVLFWMYLQWQLEEQLREAQEYAVRRGMLVGLYLDEALAVDRDGADCWAWSQFFHDGFTVGAPPDAFAPDGQEWGFPPPDRDRHRCSGYELFRKQLHASCRNAGALRIDHVMQIHQLFWIPPSGRPADGVYVKDYEEDLLSVMCLASQIDRTMVVGEDLGTLPHGFRDRLMARGVFSYRLFYFERWQDGNLLSHSEYPRWALVSISTHDLPTFEGFWGALDIDERREMGMLDPEREQQFREDRTHHKAKIIEKLVQEGFLPAPVAHAAWESPAPTDELHAAVLKFLFHTPSAMVVINQEDIFLDPRQQNFPGTTWQHPNWVTKMRYSVEELTAHPEATRLAEKFSRLLKESGRSAARCDPRP